MELWDWYPLLSDPKTTDNDVNVDERNRSSSVPP